MRYILVLLVGVVVIALIYREVWRQDRNEDEIEESILAQLRDHQSTAAARRS